jgi:hypothetical protein
MSGLSRSGVQRFAEVAASHVGPDATPGLRRAHRIW